MNKIETNKFTELLTEENMDIVVSALSIVETEEVHKFNLIESIANVVYCSQDYFNTFSIDEKIDVMAMIAITFDTLLDVKINPLAAKHIKIALGAFNNNIYSAIGGK
jgi:hypothetical protein